MLPLHHEAKSELLAGWLCCLRPQEPTRNFSKREWLSSTSRLSHPWESGRAFQEFRVLRFRGFRQIPSCASGTLTPEKGEQPRFRVSERFAGGNSLQRTESLEFEEFDLTWDDYAKQSTAAQSLARAPTEDFFQTRGIGYDTI